MVVCNEKFFESTSKEDILIRYLEWKDDTFQKPIGIVQLTHGWGEYIDRYAEMAGFLAENGYLVVGQDHMAHGYTAEVDFLGIYPEDAGVAMVEDMHKLYGIYHKEYPETPYFLYGHSMGSMLTRAYIQKYSKELAGAVICGTGWAPMGATPLKPLL